MPKKASAEKAVRDIRRKTRRRFSAEEAQQQAYSRDTAGYDRAYGACLRGRGYTVN